MEILTKLNFSDTEIRRRLRLGEDSRFEFKQFEFRGNRPVAPDRTDLADELAAFANGNGGVLFCGVTDSGHIQGMTRAQLDAVERMVVDICSDTVKPSIEIDTMRLELEEKPFLAVEVAAGYALHISPGGSYRRVGSSKRIMMSDDQLRLAQLRAQARYVWFDKQPVPGTGFGTLEESLWRPLLSVRGSADPELALTKVGLLSEREDGPQLATVAGILLCSQHPEEWLPNACITATTYRGTNRASGQVDAQTIVGPLNQQISEAVAFAIRNMRVSAHKNPGRIDLPQFSERAIFEAVVNAVAHRDYSIRGSRIRLSVFSDRLEIQSPGALPNSLTVANIADRQATRNELLVSVLGRMQIGEVRGRGDRQYFMERRGDGVPIIQRETLKVSGRPADFRIVDDAELLVILPSAPLEPSAAQVLIAVRDAKGPLRGVDVLVLFPNHTWQRATSDEEGMASVSLHTTELPMTVFAAAEEYAAHLEHDWTPSQRALVIEMNELPGGGSVIFPEGTGTLPGLKGRLNPIRDTHDRTYLYTSNVAVNQGAPQPVSILLHENLLLTDAVGSELLAKFVEVAGRSALVQFSSHQQPQEG
ncbi:MAG: putative DNA binding domain-containing protein [Caldilineaceae bacterium]|nr:putative DNA binding domain-containing protein [Caldilineaceae bacterium]MDE0337286.1 putative DNA binding domain-containing protein [Caldilineaceae bacterium]